MIFGVGGTSEFSFLVISLQMKLVEVSRVRGIAAQNLYVVRHLGDRASHKYNLAWQSVQEAEYTAHNASSTIVQ